MREPNYLFSKYDWRKVQDHQKQQLIAEVTKMDGNRLLNTSTEDLCNYFAEKYSIYVPTLYEDRIVADQKETQIDVRGDQIRYIRDRNRPYYIPGTEIVITVPFDGEAEVFDVSLNPFANPPIADIQGNSLILRIQGTDLKPEQVRAQVDKTLSRINKDLNILHKVANEFNEQLRNIAREAIERRKEKLLSNQELVASLGFALKERKDATKTYVSPEVRRKILPILPPASNAPYKPEPILSNDDYEHIINVIQNMAQVMERSPSAFTSINEEALRSHFLVQLNGHYEGQATAETFNYEGKTDILIRVEGKNIFIAECKYWNGPKKLIETIDQLLGYSSWRDTKVAIIIFNRRKNFSKVLEVIPATVESHSSCKRSLGQISESSYRYIFSNRDDPNREMVLSVLAFDVPKLT